MAKALQRQPRNWVALVLSVVTGLGHFYLDHYVAGAVLFGLFITSLNGVFLGFTLQATSSPEVLRAVSIFAFVVVWTFGFWHAYRLSFGTDRVALAQAKETLLREGLIDYLRDDLEDAARKIERAAALDVDWIDPDPLFHLGVVASRLAERRAARGDTVGARDARKRALGAFKGCLARDPSRKWRAEVAEELRRMRQATFTSRMRKVGASLKDALATASGMFARPPIGARQTHADTGSSPAVAPPAGRATAIDPIAPQVRAEIRATRKKKRFSAKYPALTKADLEGRTHADLGLPAMAPAAASGEPLPETKPELGGLLDAAAVPLADRERSGVRRFPKGALEGDDGAGPAPGDGAPPSDEAEDSDAERPPLAEATAPAPAATPPADGAPRDADAPGEREAKKA